LKKATLRAQKVKDACYCDCQNKKAANPTETTSEYFSSKKKEIANQDDPPSQREQENDETRYELTQDQNSSQAEVCTCPCICHGMYTNGLLTDMTRENELKKIQKLPQIFFCTRTHKQITNIIKEFRKTSYSKNVKMTILASRQHTCIHPQVSRMSNKNELCKKLNKKEGLNSNDGEDGTKRSESLGGCTFYNKVIFYASQVASHNFYLKNSHYLLLNINFSQFKKFSKTKLFSITTFFM